MKSYGKARYQPVPYIGRMQLHHTPLWTLTFSSSLANDVELAG